jgi:hypothetical protein
MSTKGITLYRGITPGSFGIDVHGGYGETWVRDFEHAKCYARSPEGYVLEAILYPSAKRLVLMTKPDEEGFTYYVPEGIQTLAQLVDYPWLYDSLQSGRRHLWEVWDEEWTEAVIKAGYDSVFTGGFDGPEEYVLNPNVLQFVRYHRVLPDEQTKAYPIKSGTLEELGYVVGLKRTRKVQVHGA